MEKEEGGKSDSESETEGKPPKKKANRSNRSRADERIDPFAGFALSSSSSSLTFSSLSAALLEENKAAEADRELRRIDLEVQRQRLAAEQRRLDLEERRLDAESQDRALRARELGSFCFLPRPLPPSALLLSLPSPFPSPSPIFSLSLQLSSPSHTLLSSRTAARGAAGVAISGCPSGRSPQGACRAFA